MLFKSKFLWNYNLSRDSGFWDNVISLPPSTAFYNLPQKKKKPKQQKQNHRFDDGKDLVFLQSL